MTKTPVCWRCGANVESELIGGKVPFRAVCPKCLAALHSCFGCTHYKKGAPNDCDVPDVEPVKEKDAPNFSEDFKPLFELRDKTKASTSDIEKRLFADDSGFKKKDPKDLFSD